MHRGGVRRTAGFVVKMFNALRLGLSYSRPFGWFGFSKSKARHQAFPFVNQWARQLCEKYQPVVEESKIKKIEMPNSVSVTRSKMLVKNGTTSSSSSSQEMYGNYLAPTMQQLVDEIWYVNQLALQLKENVEISTALCESQVAICNPFTDIRYYFLRSRCASVGGNNYIFVNSDEELEARNGSQGPSDEFLVKEVTLRFTSSTDIAHCYVSNGCLFNLTTELDGEGMSQSVIRALKGVNHVTQSSTWFFKDLMAQGALNIFLSPCVTTPRNFVINCGKVGLNPLDVVDADADPKPVPNLYLEPVAIALSKKSLDERTLLIKV